MLKVFAQLVLVAALAVPGFAEDLDYFLIKDVTYNTAIPKPSWVLTRGLGEQPVRHDQLVQYLRSVAAASDRISIETIARTHEGRPVLFLVVTSPENHGRLDDIRAAHVARTQGSGSAVGADDPVVTWVNYGVHGAEASGMDAVIPTVYTLAAGEGPRIDALLKDSVILITAVFNPDGHNRRASWVTQYGSNVVATDVAHEIHHHYWPGGRTNHYWFDLNRQWLLQTQPESRGWLAKWHQWKPHVSADMHEMGGNSTYYFHPGVPTRKYPLIPARGRELLVEISNYHKAYFDEERKLYFAEEGFDNFYIGKGSTYPQVNGGLGILFEAGAQMGIARESDQGIKTYANNIRNHYQTSMTTIFGSHAMRSKLQAYRAEFFASAADLAAEDDVKAYVFRAPEDPKRVQLFLDLLARHDVRVYRVQGSVKAGDATFGEDSYIVPLNQPQYRMAKGMFNRITDFEDKVFYDVSGWTLPLAYGLDYGEVTGRVSRNLGDAAQATEIVGSAPAERPYAYVFSWTDYYAPRAANRLLQAGIEVRAALEPITVETASGPKRFARGAVIVPLERQPVSDAKLADMMQGIARDLGLTITGATSGSTREPGRDLGGRNSVADLDAPKPLLVVGPGFSPYDAGEMWHQLDVRMRMAVTLVRQERLGSVDWDRYTHLLIPGGNRLSVLDRHVDRIKDWQHAGGTVVAIRQGAKWAAEKLGGYKAAKTDDAEPVRLTYADKGQNDAAQVIGGAVFESNLDISHPLGFGYVRDRVATHRNTTIKLPVPKDPYGQVAVYTGAPLLSGYASDERVEELQGSPMLTAERVGAGALILFADNPNFRATYRGTEKLFMNALFFSTAFTKARTGDEAVESLEENHE